jgi:hypothetical protein
VAAKKSAGVKVKKPVSIWRKPVKLQTAKFAAALGIHDIAVGDWKSTAGDLEKAVEATGLSTDPGEIAWKLILRALVRAMFDLLDEGCPFAPDAPIPDREPFAAALETALGAAEIALERTFFDRPRDLPLLGAISDPLAGWLTAHGAIETEARAIVGRLPAFFTYALHQEWHERATKYAPLLQSLDTPFAKAGERERAWERYAARLDRQIHESMLGEPFGIAEVFIPLRGYWEEDKEPDDPRAACRTSAHDRREEAVRHVLDVGDDLASWIALGGKDGPTLRVLAGGPGSGKSSLAKIFAARVSAKGQRVLYVPLHLIDPEKDLETAIGHFVRQQDILPDNPLDPASGEPLLLLLLDALDELAMQGKAAAEVARKFVEEVGRLVDNRNHDGVRLLVLIGGRDVVVQMSRSELRKPRQVIHLLPYYMSKEAAKPYVDPHNLLAADHRDLWWQCYGAAKGTDRPAMPAALRRRDLDEITAQPLLGYLVALSFERGKIDFSRVSTSCAAPTTS